MTLTGVVRGKYSLTVGFDHEKDVVRHVTRREGDVLVTAPVNIDRVEQWYVALSIPVRLTRWWNLAADLIGDYTRNKMSEYSVKGGRFQGRVVNTFMLPRDFEADMTYLFTTGNIIGETRMEPIFDKLDLSVRKSFWGKRLTINLFVDNVLDFRRWPFGETTQRPEVFSARSRSHDSYSRRTYGVTVRWNFGAGGKIKAQKVVSGNSAERGRQSIEVTDGR